MRRLWVVLVTEGRRLRFAPEVYPTQLRAEREAYRWGWFLAGGVEAKIQIVDEHHWRIGRTRVHSSPRKSVRFLWRPNFGWASAGDPMDSSRRLACFSTGTRRWLG